MSDAGTEFIGDLRKLRGEVKEEGKEEEEREEGEEQEERGKGEEEEE